MRKNQANPRHLLSRILLLSCLIVCVPAAFAQSGDRAARAAQWDGYQLPAGKFTRYVDRQNGFSFRLPADWKQQPGASGVMQSFRNEPIKPESAIVRRVMSGGLEWREITHEVEVPGGVTVRQTMWFTAVGPRAYGLALSAQNGEMEAYEPIFKRIVSSVRIGAAGHWNEEFETLRAGFTAESNPESEGEIEVGRIAEALRTGRE